MLQLKVQRNDSSDLWDPAAAESANTPTTTEAIQRQRDHGAPVAPESEAAIIDAILRPVPAATLAEAGAIRERALVMLVMQLPANDAYGIERRLQIGSGRDPIVAAFARLITERRTRVRDALAYRRRMRG